MDMKIVNIIHLTYINFFYYRYGLTITMLLWGVFLALETSNLPKQFNEGNFFNYILYNINNYYVHYLIQLIYIIIIAKSIGISTCKYIIKK